MAQARSDVHPYDALLVVSFGGPEGPQDVMPFLRNVTAGRGVPPERLAEVAQHYQRFGGVSPINAQCRELIDALRADLAANGVDLPVYWGNRNWDPYLADTLARMTEDGVRRAIVFVTSAYASYSGCRQYRENLADALASDQVALAAKVSGNEPPRLDKIRHYFNHPGFAEPMRDATLRALDSLPEGTADGATLLFVTHSIPTDGAAASGPAGGAYVAQHTDLARWIAEQVTTATGVEHPWRLVYCSRSGSPRQPWLEPDINEELAAVHAAGASAAVVVPIGFISDHMEVVFDLDTEAAETARELNLPMRRVPTVGAHPRFVAAIRELVLERAGAERDTGAQPSRAAVGRLGPSHDLCPAGCCRNPRGARPAVCGID